MLLQLLTSLHKCLEAIVSRNAHPQLGTDWTWDGESVNKESGYLFQLESSTFLIPFQILLQFFQLLREVTIKLQMRATDVVYALKTVKEVLSMLTSMRASSTTKLFLAAAKLGKLLNGNHFELTMPRLSGRQSHRSNPPSTTAEEYYRISLHNEFISHVLAKLEQRFVNNPSHMT